MQLRTAWRVAFSSVLLKYPMGMRMLLFCECMHLSFLRKFDKIIFVRNVVESKRDICDTLKRIIVYVDL